MYRDTRDFRAMTPRESEREIRGYAMGAICDPRSVLRRYQSGVIRQRNGARVLYGYRGESEDFV